jgi:hypothetical protein
MALSSEPTSSSPAKQVAASCPACAAAVATDQRYCLHCGARLTPMSSVLREGPRGGEQGGVPPTGRGMAPASPPPALASGVPGSPAALDTRSPTLNTIAGVGVLLLAMGVGVLIGRSSGSTKAGAATPQVISVASAPTSTNPAAEPTFNDDWPSEKTGFTVQLEALSQSGTKVSAVESAKSAATAKGAKDVGALKSEDFSSLTAGSYVIYSGVYTEKTEAEKALPGLKKDFSGAKVIEVSNGAAPGEPPESNKVGESLKHPAPPSVLEKVNKAKGKSYVQKSKELPNVISTG